MHQIFVYGPTSAVAAFAIVAIWHWRRSHRRWRFRKSDYAWVFFQSGIAYVMTIILIEHFYFDVSYIQIVSRNFGHSQISMAFAGALWEALKSLWEMCLGNG